MIDPEREEQGQAQYAMAVENRHLTAEENIAIAGKGGGQERKAEHEHMDAAPKTPGGKMKSSRPRVEQTGRNQGVQGHAPEIGAQGMKEGIGNQWGPSFSCYLR